MRAALGEALVSAGYHTDVFADGEAAERHLKQNGADLVVSDVRMPNLGGLELLKRFPNIPFIMISGFATVPEAVEAMKIGAYDFVVKPFSYRELIPLVNANYLDLISTKLGFEQLQRVIKHPMDVDFGKFGGAPGAREVK